MTRGPTERVMLDALHARLSRLGGMSARHVVAEHVRYDPAWGHSIADAISVDTWKASGRGHCLHGYEVKVSRSDWRRELVPYTDRRGRTSGGPEKSLTWRQHCAYWWIVTPPGIVRDDLPPGWGHLVLQGRWLHQATAAKRVPDPLPLPPAALAGLMRATANTASFHALTPAQRLLLERLPEDAPASMRALQATVDTSAYS